MKYDVAAQRRAALSPAQGHPSLTDRLPSAGIAGTSGGLRFRYGAFILEKGKCEGHSAVQPKVSGKNCVFSRNDRPYGLKRNVFQTKNAYGAFPQFCLVRTVRRKGGGRITTARRLCPLRREKRQSWEGRRGKKRLFSRSRGTVAEGGGGGVSVAVVFPGKARWGGEGGAGEGEPLSREQRGSPSPGYA